MTWYSRCNIDRTGRQRPCEKKIRDPWQADYLSSVSELVMRTIWVGGPRGRRLESMDLDCLGIKFKTFLLVDQELLYILSLIALKLNHLTHLTVIDDGAIASKLLLDDLENLLLIEFLGETLYSGQSLTTIALLNPNMDVILRLLGLASVFVGLGEGVEGFEVLDSGHKLVCSLGRFGWVLKEVVSREGLLLSVARGL